MDKGSYLAKKALIKGGITSSSSVKPIASYKQSGVPPVPSTFGALGRINKINTSLMRIKCRASQKGERVITEPSSLAH